jgi:hypothetical protein
MYDTNDEVIRKYDSMMSCVYSTISDIVHVQYYKYMRCTVHHELCRAGVGVE